MIHTKLRSWWKLINYCILFLYHNSSIVQFWVIFSGGKLIWRVRIHKKPVSCWFTWFGGEILRYMTSLGKIHYFVNYAESLNVWHILLAFNKLFKLVLLHQSLLTNCLERHCYTYSRSTLQIVYNYKFKSEIESLWHLGLSSSVSHQHITKMSCKHS